MAIILLYSYVTDLRGRSRLIPSGQGGAFSDPITNFGSVLTLNVPNSDIYKTKAGRHVGKSDIARSRRADMRNAIPNQGRLLPRRRSPRTTPDLADPIASRCCVPVTPNRQNKPRPRDQGPRVRDLARRKPRSQSRAPGEKRPRYADRQRDATPYQLPPRETRKEPLG